MSWIDHLKEHVNAENKDSFEYTEIAKLADNEGCCHEAGVLRDIAHEEHMHEKLLNEMLMEHKK